MADVFDHCEKELRAGDRDRFLATLFAPQKHRRALAALYAFDLELGRVREMAREPLPGELRLQWWRDAVAGGAGNDEARAHPVVAALREAAVRFRLPPQAIVDIIDARTFDLYDEPMDSVAALEDYARTTTAAVLGLAARVLLDGRDPDRDPAAGLLIDHAGMAMGIAAVLRALPAHAARGQRYLPTDLMARHGAKEADLFAGRATPALAAVLSDLRGLVRNHLDVAAEHVAAVSEAIGPALLPAVLVRPRLERMERRGADPFRPVDLPQWRRQWMLWRATRRGLGRAFA